MQPQSPCGEGIPSPCLSKCVFQRVTSCWSHFFPLPSDNSFWDVLHTTTTKQPKTTRAPRKPNPGEHELPSPPRLCPGSAASAAKCFGMRSDGGTAPRPVLPVSSLFVDMRHWGKIKKDPWGSWWLLACFAFLCLFSGCGLVVLPSTAHSPAVPGFTGTLSHRLRAPCQPGTLLPAPAVLAKGTLTLKKKK